MNYPLTLDMDLMNYNLEDLVTELPKVMGATGPVFVCLKVNHDNEVPDFYMGNTGDAMRKLMAHLQA